MSEWVLVCVALGLVALALAAFLRSRRSPRETPTVALVRRRQELSERLRELAGEESMDLIRAEARRMKASSGSVEVLEAALAKAERNSANGELGASRMAPLSGHSR